MKSRIVLLCALAAVLVGCAPDAIDIVEGCVAPVRELVQRTAKNGEARCDLGRTTTFVAKPRATSSGELVAAGLTEDAAYTLAGTGQADSWCSLDRVVPADPIAKPGWEAHCTAAGVEIHRLLVVNARSIVILIGPSTTRAQLIGIRATE